MKDLTRADSNSAQVTILGLALACCVVLSACSGSEDPSEVLDGPPNDVGGEPPVPTLADAPSFASGTAYDLAWSVPEPDSDLRFQAQRATDPDFSVDLEVSDWIAATQHTFNNLVDATTYHYRVRSRFGAGPSSAFSAPAQVTQDAVPPSAQIGEMDTEQTSLRFDLPFSATDVGSGVAAVEIWVRGDAPVFQHYGTFTASPVEFVAETGGSHSFYALAVDEAGNRQAIPAQPQRTTQIPDPVILVDNEGFAWDITNAVHRYGLRVENWGNGLGRNIIPPIVEPEMVGVGEPGFPDEDNIAIVIGVTVDGAASAYKQGDLNGNEVVDDMIGGTHLAVTY